MKDPDPQKKTPSPSNTHAHSLSRKKPEENLKKVFNKKTNLKDN